MEKSKELKAEAYDLMAQIDAHKGKIVELGKQLDAKNQEIYTYVQELSKETQEDSSERPAKKRNNDSK
jgi:ABC-type oligopeptide transport system ATPase subunit